ncbi:MAG TPA: hypothetical protein VG675_08880 [Bryobacteraceae bacterium]|nr:hypothetical protein [Bryobacteraceae bacterium]
MNRSQYAVKLTDTAEAAYCELYIRVEQGVQPSADLQALDEALDNLPTTANDRKFQLAGKFSAVYRQKIGTLAFTYKISDPTESIIVVEISPLTVSEGRAHVLFNQIVTQPKFKEARAVLGIPEKESIGVGDLTVGPPIN